MKKEYDFTEGERGKYARRFEKGTNLVRLVPEVAMYFPSAQSVNRSLNRLISEGKIDMPHKSCIRRKTRGAHIFYQTNQ